MPGTVDENLEFSRDDDVIYWIRNGCNQEHTK